MYIKQLPFERLGNVSFKVVTLENVDSSMLRNLSDVAIAGQERSIVALFAVQEEKVNLIVRVTKDLTNKITANELARIGANLLGGGGGRSDFAQAGGKDPRKINEVVSQMKQLIMQRI
jgi:alanyl-tRNA synthetase